MTGRYCPTCGATHGPEDHFCEECGTVLDPHPAATPAGVGAGVHAPTGPPGPQGYVGAPGGPPAGPARPGFPYPSEPASPGSPPGPPPSPARGGLGTTGWVLVAVAGVLLVAAGITAVLVLSGDEDPTVAGATDQPTPTDQVTADQPTATPTAQADDDKPSAGPVTLSPEGTSVDVTAAGVDFAWVTLPAASAYEDVEWVVDDSGAVTVQIPTAWADRDMSANTYDGVAAPSIWAAADLEAFVDQWSGPGVMLELLSGAPASGSSDDVLDALAESVGAADACGEVRTYDYDDGWYGGSAALHSGCGASGSALLQIVAAESVDRLLAVQVQMVTTADVEAAVTIIDTFQTVTDASPAAAPAPAPAPAPATVSDLDPGLLCRDVQAFGFGYADAVTYWDLEGQPSRMDADGNGIPCETVYPAGEIEGYWGVTPDEPAPADDEWMEAITIAENAMYACGYAPALDTYADGPYADGGYAVSMSVDVGWDIISAEFEVFPWSGQVYGFDAVADDLLSCAY